MPSPPCLLMFRINVQCIAHAEPAGKAAVLSSMQAATSRNLQMLGR